MKRSWLRLAWMLTAVLLLCSGTIAALADDQYTLTVEGGKGGGRYAAGTLVPLRADAAPEGQVFCRWSCTAGVLDDAYKADAVITMPAADAAVTASYTAKARVKISGVSVADKIYDGQPAAPAGQAATDAATELPAADFVYTYYAAGSGEALIGPPKDAGAYRLIVTVADTNEGYFGTSGDIAFTITPATLTITPASGQTRLIGLANPAFSYEAEGAIAGETPAFSGALSGAADENAAAGDYALSLGTLAPADNGAFLAANYTLSMAPDVHYAVVPFVTEAAATAAETNLGKDGVYTGDITLLAPEGYAISLAQTGADYADSVTVPAFSGTATTYYYLKEKATGAITGARAILLSCSETKSRGGDLPALTGELTITGPDGSDPTPRYGQTLTAAYTGLDGLNLHYTWYRGQHIVKTETPDDPAQSYQLGSQDIGGTLYVSVSADGYEGSVESAATAEVQKAKNTTVPAAPSARARTSTSVTLQSASGYEYSMDGSNWGDAGFDGLEPGTTYSFYCRVKESATTLASASSEAASIATYGALEGTIGISGNPVFGGTLRASLSGANDESALLWRWLRGETPVGSAQDYTVTAEDVGKTLTVEATSTAQSGKLSQTSAVIGRADYAGALPGAPTAASVTGTSVTLTAVEGYEYSCGGSQWQTNAAFPGLRPQTEYTFYQRVRETDTHLCSGSSAGLTLTTVSSLSGTIYISGELRFGKTLVASFGQDNNSGELSYTWKRGTMTVGTGANYNVQAVDIGNQLSVEVTSSVQYGSVTRILGKVKKAEYVGNTPDAPTRLARSSSSVTLTPVTGNEYSLGGENWQSSNRFTGLNADTTYKFYQRVKATSTIEASPASKALSVTTNAGSPDDDDGDTDDTGTTDASTVLYSLTLTGDNTRVLSTSLGNLIRGNQSQDVTIRLDNASFTFFKGTMQAVPGQLWYDFGVKINGCIHEQAARTAAGDHYVSTIHYNYEGALPARANIKLWLGAAHAGKTLYYYQLDTDTNSLRYMQSAIVDTTGWVTVVQDSCSDYVFCDADVLSVTPTPEPIAATPTPTAEPIMEPAGPSAGTQRMSGWMLTLIICVALLFIIGGIWLYIRNRDG